MSGLPRALEAHLAGGITTVCRAWELVRRDGRVLAFTDHDRDLSWDGVVFQADSGLTAAALEQSTGLSVDNSEAMGALSSGLISDDDIAAGRYDGAEVRAWLVNWADVAQRVLLFRGTLGEVKRAGGAFHAELRGLAEALNQPQGRVFQAPCAAVLGDAHCGVDLSDPDFSAEQPVRAVERGKVLWLDGLDGYGAGWFERGRLRVLDGAAAGLVGVVKSDRGGADGRRIELWEAMRAGLAPGDRVRLEAGCDKRLVTCRARFGNAANYRGFPTVPGEDWLTASPSAAASRTSG